MRLFRNLFNIISPHQLYKIRDIVLSALNFFGLNELFRLLNRKKFLILWYHGISHSVLPFSNRHVAESKFEIQLKYLKNKRYNFITLTQLIEILNNKKKFKSRYVILSFDDGFHNIIKNAYPIMKKYNAKGCLYVISSLIGNDQFLWTDYIDLLVRNSKGNIFNFKFDNKNVEYPLISEIMRKTCIKDIKNKLRSINNDQRIYYLSQFIIPNKKSSFSNVPEDYIIADWKDLTYLDHNFLEIGSHTKTHPNLPRLQTDEDFKRELYDSKLDIDNHLQYKVNHLCYPAGAFNQKTIKFAKKFKYLTGVTTIYGLNSQKCDLFKLKRLRVDNNLILFKAKVSGLYPFLKRFFKIIKINKII